MGDLQAEELVNFISDRTRLQPDRVARILAAGILEWVKSTYEPSDSGIRALAKMILKEEGERGAWKFVGVINSTAFKTDETPTTVWEVTQALLDFLSHKTKSRAERK